MTSPSSINTFLSSPIISSIFFFKKELRVDLPAPESPVNQKVAPLFKAKSN
jgi:hypothetical protein